MNEQRVARVRAEMQAHGLTQMIISDSKSIWYLTDGGMIGFRVVRPLHIPDVITMHRLWNFSKGEP